MTLVLDAGALIGFERGNRTALVLVTRAVERGDPVVVPAGVLAQVWRGGARQVRLGSLLRRHVAEVVALDEREARLVGALLARSRTSDVVDASVVWCARKRGALILTSDPEDLRRIDHLVRVQSL
jgi:predicted nucleic acid-binding protein